MLQNEKYIDFANENTVEVVALGRLQEGISKNDPKAAEYDAKDENGNPVKYLKSYAGMTAAEMIALSQSKAASYNDTGKIPFLCIVDPYDESEMKRFPGGLAAGGLMEAVVEQRKVLNSKHGASLSRGTLTKVDTETRRIAAEMPKAGAARSLADYRKLEKSLAKEPEVIRKRIEPTLEKILEAAGADLDSAEAKIGAGDVPGAKKLLDKFGKLLDGTTHELRYKELVGKCKPAPAPK